MSDNVLIGRHPAVARNWDLGWTKGSDTAAPGEQIAVMFEIVDGPAKGRFVQWFGYFTEKTMDRTMESMRYCGWQSDDVTNPVGMDSYMVELVIEMEQSNTDPTKSYPRVRWVNKFGGGALSLAKPMDDKERRAFAAKMKARAAKIKRHEGIAAPPPGNAPAPSRDDGQRRAAESANGWGSDGPPPRGDGDAPPPSRGKQHDDIPF